MSAWCRSCGSPQTAQHGQCTHCHVELSIDPPPPSSIGLIYEVRGRLGVGKKQGICLTEKPSGELLLHFSARDKEPTVLPGASSPSGTVPSEHCPVTRLLYAASLVDTDFSFDKTVLLARARELCSDIRMVRRTFDDAMTLGWDHILAWCPLSDSEKAWRRAHHAATAGTLDQLRVELSALPVGGYPTRGELILPHLPAIAHNRQEWLPTLRALQTGGTDPKGLYLNAAFATWEHALESGLTLLPESRRATWKRFREHLENGQAVPTPPASDTPAWNAASLITISDGNKNLDPVIDELYGLEPALLDDLVDAGRVTRVSDGPGNTQARRYLRARLDPTSLSEDDLRAVGHLSELARRYYLARNRAALSGLRETPRVRHYQALLDVVEGGRPDPSRLDPAATRALAAPGHALEQIRAGELAVLPDEVAADPSLWPMFTDLAITGKLFPDPHRPAQDPLNTWIGLLRLQGLLWEGRFSEAVEHGNLLIPHLRSEDAEDEARNLTAFAQFQLGWVADALASLEYSLKGKYTENLLINVGIVAAYADPETAIGYLVRLVNEAPNRELEQAALEQAIKVWKSSDEPFPRSLIPAITTALGRASNVAEFMPLAKLLAVQSPDDYIALRRPKDQLSGPYDVLLARAKLKSERTEFNFRDLANVFVEVHKRVGRPDWFDNEWDFWVSLIRESVFVDFGSSPGSVVFIDTVLVQAPNLFKQEDRLILAPQAGAHLATSMGQSGSWLNDLAWAKFFFEPAKDFMAARHAMDHAEAEFLADNLTLCIGVAGHQMLGACRDEVADQYNPLVERLRWDSTNTYAILSQMSRILDNAERDSLATLKLAVETMRRLGSQTRRDAVREIASEVSKWQNEIASLKRDLP